MKWSLRVLTGGFAFLLVCNEPIFRASAETRGSAELSSPPPIKRNLENQKMGICPWCPALAQEQPAVFGSAGRGGAVPCSAVLSCACGCPARARRGYRALPLPAGAGGSRRCSIRERQEPREAGRDLPISGRLRGGDTDKMAAPNWAAPGGGGRWRWDRAGAAGIAEGRRKGGRKGREGPRPVGAARAGPSFERPGRCRRLLASGRVRRARGRRGVGAVTGPLRLGPASWARCATQPWQEPPRVTAWGWRSAGVPAGRVRDTPPGRETLLACVSREAGSCCPAAIRAGLSRAAGLWLPCSC